jgi:N6-adenosine-specific RNA methylase IME4
MNNMKTYEYHTIANIFPLMTTEEMAELTSDIKYNGLKTPIVLYEDKILDGRNRYQACVSASVDPTFTEYKGNTPYSDVMSLNIQRRHLTAGQKACVAEEMWPHITNERKRISIYEGSEPTHTYSNSPLETAAKVMKVSSKSIQLVRKLKKEEPEIYEKVKKGGYTLKDAQRNLKVNKRKIDIKKIEEKIITENQTITDKYDVLVLDPPWPYGREFDPDTSRVANPYPEMNIEEIGDTKLPIKDTAVVFLWTTHAFLKDAFNILDKWGLTYKATLVWDKEQMGMGNTIRMQCEFCLLGIKGTPIIQGSDTRDIIREKRREHSRKPNAFYELVDKITMGSKLDYFAREQRKGWNTHGIEDNKFGI